MTATIEERLAEIRRRIDLLLAREVAGPGAARARRRFAALRNEEASVHTALGQRRADVEELVWELELKLEVAERSLAADAAKDWAAYDAAVDAELRSWDAYLEWMQTTVAARAGAKREEAEAAIRAVRERRIEVAELLARARSNGAVPDLARQRITAARARLEQHAGELAFHGR